MNLRRLDAYSVFAAALVLLAMALLVALGLAYIGGGLRGPSVVAGLGLAFGLSALLYASRPEAAG